jgi:hypothetical protein
MLCDGRTAFLNSKVAVHSHLLLHVRSERSSQIGLPMAAVNPLIATYAMSGAPSAQRFLDCSLWRTRVSAPHYFLGAIESLAAFATRNFTTVLALI